MAVRTHRTLAQAVEEGLRLALATKKAGLEPVKGLVLPTFGGSGLNPGVDLDDMGNVLDAMDKDDFYRR